MAVRTDAAGADRDAQRVVRELVEGLAGVTTHRDLDGVCRALGLPVPSEEQISARARQLHPDDASLSKRERVTLVYDLIQGPQYRQVLAGFLRGGGLDAPTRVQIQDLLGEGTAPPISARARREVARALNPFELGLDAPVQFMALLDQLWVLDVDAYPRPTAETFGELLPSLGDGWGTRNRQTLRREIQRHVLNNRGDWDVPKLFDILGVWEVPDARFARLVEGLVSGRVTPDEGLQRQMVEAMNPALAGDGAQLREVAIEDGYPVFTLVGQGRPQVPVALVLFASRAVKPDLRLRDVLDGSLELLSDSEEVLAYDRPVGTQGLTWGELREWWTTGTGIDGMPRQWTQLWARLRDCLAETGSPPQRLLFDAYATGPGLGLHKPALLPEVWVHWDPKSVASRSPEDRLLTQRMDFLMFLPGLRRVVLEVDGVQHYSDDAGIPSPTVYAKTMAGDRDLRLSGYEVYRFGGAELCQSNAVRTVTDFFTRLLA